MKQIIKPKLIINFLFKRCVIGHTYANIYSRKINM